MLCVLQHPQMNVMARLKRLLLRKDKPIRLLTFTINLESVALPHQGFRASSFCNQISGDPHFFGFKGQKYDVMGQSYEIYNIISASYLQINSEFIPYYKTATQVTPTGTMMGTIGNFH